MAPVGGVGGAPKGGMDLGNTVVSDQKGMGVSVDDFLNLMVQQLANQDFMNPMDDTQYITQLAQFASMQEMQNLAYYSQSNYVMSLIGKDVTVAQLSLGGNVTKVTAPVEKISIVDGEYQVFVKGKGYRLDQIMEIHSPVVEAPGNPDKPNTDTSKEVAYSAITYHSAEVSWKKQPGEDLRYSVYYSKDKEMDSLQEIKENGRLVGDAERKDLTREIVTGLEQGTVYYVNVIVTDPEGKQSVLKKAQFTTALKPEDA